MDSDEIESEQRGTPLGRALTDTRRDQARIVGLVFTLVPLVVLVVLLAAGRGSWVGYLFLGVLAALGAAVLLAALRARDTWDNPQLFLPHNEPLRLGEQAIARYRRPARRSGLAERATVAARLMCEERRAGSREAEAHRQVVWQADVPTTAYPAPKLVEADLHLDIPVFDAPPTMDLPTAEVRWRLEVVTTVDDKPVQSVFPVIIAPELAPALVDPT